MKTWMNKIDPVAELLERYITAFLHPIKLHLSMRDERLYREHEKHLDGTENLLFLPSFPLPQAPAIKKTEEEPVDHFGLNFTEVLSISWMLRFVKAAYSLLFMYVGLSLYQNYLSTADEGSTSTVFMGETWQFKLRTVMILMLLLELVFFPVMAWFMAKLWTIVISFFARLFEVEGDVETIAKQVVHVSFTTHLFFLIPIFGELLHQLSSWFYMYVGLKKNMQLTNVESLVILAVPTLAVVFAISFGVLWLLFLLQLSWQIFTF